MVFESVVADILNIYLGDYVENLDHSQLQIGIWGGDVVLQDLSLKPNVFDELNLPIKCTYGHLGRLILKIPWKNLYGAPVIAKVERLFLLAKPDPDSHTRSTQNAKRAELQRLEVARHLKNEADKTKTSDTFVEKLATQIIKNIQISIEDIHIRYEDDITSPKCPFSLGITLHRLSVQSTNKDWREGIVQDKSSMIYKVLNLEGLAVYWNCHSEQFSFRANQKDVLTLFQNGIFMKTKCPKGFSYILGPINSAAQLQLNPKPESDTTPFTIPKILLTLMMEKLAVGISKEQYHCLVELLDFFDFAHKLAGYQKYRPSIPRCKGNYKEWWKFATACVLSHRWRGIDWKQVQRHRATCRAYASAYMCKCQATGTLSSETEKALKQCEEVLDVFNVMLIRRQVEAEVAWLNKKSPKVQKPGGISSWLGSWWGSGNTSESDLTDKFKHELTQEERLKLYQALDYEEDAAPTLYPEQFVERQVVFQLGKLTVELRNLTSRVLLAELSGVSSTLEQRPVAGAFRMVLNMTQLNAWGIHTSSVPPHLVQSLTHLEDGSETALMKLFLETNPLDGSCGRRLRIQAAPLQFIYDAYTVNELAGIFQGPRSDVLVQWQAAAEAHLSDMSALGLQYAIEHHVMTEIEVDMKSSRVLVPHGGSYTGHENLLVVNLGQLNVATLPRELASDPRLLHQQGLSEKLIVETMRAETYDRFLVELKNIQVLLAVPGEDWDSVLRSRTPGFMHLLEPISLACHVDKCLVQNDPSLPNVKVKGQLSIVSFTVEDNRLIRLMKLYDSIPFPESEEKSELTSYISPNTKFREEILQEDLKVTREVTTNSVKLHLEFTMQGMTATLYKSAHGRTAASPKILLQLSASHFGFSLRQRASDLSVSARLGGVTLVYHGREGALKLLDPEGLDTVDSVDTLDMLTIKYTNVDEEWRNKGLFQGEVCQFLDADFSHLTIQLHKEILLDLLDYCQGLNKRLEACLTSSENKQKALKIEAHKSSRSVKTKEFSLKVSAKLHALNIAMIQQQQVLAGLLVEGMQTTALSTSSSTTVTARLRNVSLLDPNPLTPHNKVVSILGKEALSVEVVLYNDPKKNSENMSIRAHLARSRIVFLQSFTQSVVGFLSSFQTAKENFAQVVADAAEAAKQKMLSAHAESQFVALDMSFEAPLIVVPVSATSLEALQLDFGKLVINNKLEMLAKRPVDAIKLDLQHLHVLRVKLSRDGRVLSEQQLVLPVSFTMEVFRSLSSCHDSSWPEISVKGHLDRLQVYLNCNDVHMFMRTLAENLESSGGHTEQDKNKKREIKSVSEQTQSTLSWEVVLSMSTLKMDLGLNSHHKVHFAMSGSKFALSKRKHMKVAFRIKDLMVVSPSVPAVYQKMVRVEGSEVLSVDVTVYDRNAKHTGDDITVKAAMSRIRFIYLPSLLSAMKEFLQAFNYEHEGFVEAMAEAAREEVLDVHSQATRIGLDIDLKAPVITVPHNDSIVEALLLDLGNLTVQNTFESPEDTITGHYALVDNMLLGLQNLKVSRVELGSNGEVESEVLLLEPINLMMHMKRNLTSRRLTSLPDLDLRGHLKSVVVSVNQEDIQMVLAVLNTFASDSDSPCEETSAVTTRQSDKSSPPAHQVPNVSVKFSFTMEKLVVELFNETPSLIDFLGTTRHSEESSLARCALVLLVIQGTMSGDGTLSTTLLLSDCQLDDSRPDRQKGLTRIMENKRRQSGSRAESVSLSPKMRNMEIFYVKRSSATEVKILVYSFNLVLSLEYIKLLGSFATKALEQPQRVAPKTTALQASVTQQITNLASSPTKQETEATFMLSVTAEKSDVFLVEDMSDPKTTALVLRSEIKCATHISSSAVEVKGSIEDLQLFSCVYHPEMREKTMSQILQPCSMKWEGSVPQFQVRLSNVRLRVSPGTIDLLSRVMTAVFAREEIGGEQQNIEASYSNIWLPKPLTASDHWFLKTEMGEEAIEMTAKSTNKTVHGSTRNIREICAVKMPSVTVTVEAGAGLQTLPMVMLTAGMDAWARDWSKALVVEGTISLQMAYYNSRLALWEPLIEPVEMEQLGKVSHKPWELCAKLEMENTSSQEPFFDETDAPRTPSMKIEVFSKDSLEVTVTKTCLEVLSSLGQAFQLAGDEVRREGPAAPYQVINHIGLPVTLLLSSSPFKVYDSWSHDLDHYKLEPKKSVALRADVQANLSSPLSLLTQGQAQEKFLSVQVHGCKDTVDLPVVQTGQRLFPLSNGISIISDVQVESGSTIVTLRGILQIYNNLGMPVDIHYQPDQDSDLKYVDSVSTGDHVDVPLNVVYTPSQDVYISVPGHTKICYEWSQEFSMSAEALRECKPKIKSCKESVFLRIVKKKFQAYFKETNTSGASSVFFKIFVQPSVKLKNLLAVGITISQPEIDVIHALSPGERLNVATAHPAGSSLMVQIPEYRNEEWNCTYNLNYPTAEYSELQFRSHSGKSLSLALHAVCKLGVFIATFYSPYWMLNKTGLPLSYKLSDIPVEITHSSSDIQSAVMLPSNSGGKKAYVRVADGKWSQSFSLDVAGSSGIVSSPALGQIYQLGVSVQLMRCALTKQVTLTPRFVLINSCQNTVECQEANRPADLWMRVEAGGCCPLWPVNPDGRIALWARMYGSSSVTPPFPCFKAHTSLLRLDNQWGGLNVDVQLTESSTYIRFSDYNPGQAAALLVNHSPYSIPFSEKGCDFVTTLNPGTEVLFTWMNPCGSREMDFLVKAEGMDREVCRLKRDASGKLQLQKREHVYWSSFLDGAQRVLLFSDDPALTQSGHESKNNRILRRMTMRLSGIGLSLVDNEEKLEVMYIGMSRMPRQLRQRYNKSADTNLKNQVGLWMRMTWLPHEVQLHVKVDHLQADCQLPDCIYPVALAPVPPPRSVAASHVAHPFAELSCVVRQAPHSSLKQVQYCKALIQAFHVKVDMGLLSAVMALLEAGEPSDEVETTQFLEDLRLVKAALQAHVVLGAARGQKDFFNLLHFSPLKIHLSLSLSNEAGGRKGKETPHALQVLLHSLGVTLTNAQDVVFRLAYFERQEVLLSSQEIVGQAYQHYRSQVLKQMYVFVLGLDVLGNPLNLVKGLKQGMEDMFYEPFQGAIQGPEEFAQGLALGVRSLIGHTVGGAAGAVSRITGSLGSGVAALTFDKEYQRKRQETMSQRPSSVQKGLAQSGKGLVMGVVDGVSGVFTKPISGAKKEGVEGFFKGVGKGMAGLVARPTAGIIDFASGSLDAVRRTAEPSVEFNRQRPPRFFRKDNRVRPYVRSEAEGYQILQEMEDKKFAATDTYDSHINVQSNGQKILLLTDKRIMLIHRREMFETWKMEWQEPWDALQEPVAAEDGVYLPFKQTKPGRSSSNQVRCRAIPVHDRVAITWIVEKIKIIKKS